MALGKRDLAGFIANIKDRGLGAQPGQGGRPGFAGVSKGGDKTLFYEFTSVADVVATLVRGPAVDQLIDLFDDGYDPQEPALSIKSVVYREIDPTGGTVADPGTPTKTGTGTGTGAAGGTPYRERTYAVKISNSSYIGAGDLRYQLCRNYDVVDPAHLYWEPEQRMVVTTAGPPAKSKIYLEEPNGGNWVEFTDNVVPAGSFVAGDIWTWTTAPALPTVAKTVTAVRDLASWRDGANNGIGGYGDETLIGCDRPAASTDWDDFHDVATDEWNDNIHPVQIVLSTPLAVKAAGLYVIDTVAADWLPKLIEDSATYRNATIPTNSYLNGALGLSAIWLLTDKSSNQDGPQLRHKCGSLLGMAARGRWHWNVGWVERFKFSGAKAVYPWNSKADNMTTKSGVPKENRTARLSRDGHFLVAWPRSGALAIIGVDNGWAMADPLSDYFKLAYFRVVGGIHVVMCSWFNTVVGAPGISSNDAAVLEAEMTSVLIKPRTVDPNKSGDSIVKPFNQARLRIWAEDDVLVTEQLQYSLMIVPVDSKYQLAGYSQLRRSL